MILPLKLQTYLLATILFTTVKTDDIRKLLAVNLLYRHGDRTPVNPYPNDPYKDISNWPVGYGQLTARGKMMHFQLGKFLRDRYKGFLDDKYNETDIYVRSTDVDRTLMSAMSNLAGLYPPVGDQMWNPNIPWQPIPVHTLPKSEDNLLSSNAVCPRFEELMAQLLSSNPEIQAINAKYAWVYNYTTAMSGAQVTNLVQADYISDTLYIEQVYNKTLPDWTHRVFPQPLRTMQDISFKLDTWTPEMTRLRAGPLLKTLWQRMDSIAKQVRHKGSFGGEQKVVMYSAHDTTVAYFLNSIGAFDPPVAPAYASCVIIELFQNSSGEFDIRLLFRNDTDRPPYLISQSVCGGREFCSLAEFESFTADLRPGDWVAECNNVPSDPVTWVVTVVSVSVTCLLLAVLVTSVVISLLRRRSEWKQGQSQHENEYLYSPINNS